MAGPLKGRRILATGVGGGVGQVLIQLAVAEGAEITAVAETGQPTEHMAALGAKIALDIDAVEGGAFDIALESAGGDLGPARPTSFAPAVSSCGSAKPAATPSPWTSSDCCRTAPR